MHLPMRCLTSESHLGLRDAVAGFGVVSWASVDCQRHKTALNWYFEHGASLRAAKAFRVARALAPCIAAKTYTFIASRIAASIERTSSFER